MITAIEAIAFFSIATSFIVCVVAVIRPWIYEAFCKPSYRREAQIIPFPARSRIRRGNHV